MRGAGEKRSGAAHERRRRWEGERGIGSPGGWVQAGCDTGERERWPWCWAGLAPSRAGPSGLAWEAGPGWCGFRCWAGGVGLVVLGWFRLSRPAASLDWYGLVVLGWFELG